MPAPYADLAAATLALDPEVQTSLAEQGYTDELAAQLLEWISEGKSIRAFCEQAEIVALANPPTRTRFNRWRDRHPVLEGHYARAAKFRVESFVDDTQHIADTESDAQRARVKIDQRKWALSHMDPRRFGDRKFVKLSGEEGEPPIALSAEVEVVQYNIPDNGRDPPKTGET